jgi:8-oxo-dGTP pyrophosphatase MutT (NUDIX family)
VITAGGTSEAIDDVRTLSNRSTGRLGMALAVEAAARGMRVTLIGAAPLADHVASLPSSVRFVAFTDTASLREALRLHLTPPPDAVWMAAAVADYLPKPSAGKLSSDADRLVVEAERADKLLPWIVEQVGGERVIGFKLLSGVSEHELLRVARAQRTSLGLAATVANDLQRLGDRQHPAWWVDAQGARPIVATRETTAARLLDAWCPESATATPWGPGRLAQQVPIARPGGVHPPPRPIERVALDGADPHAAEVVVGADGTPRGLGGACDAARWRAAGPGALYVHGEVVATREAEAWRLHTEDTGWIEAHARALGDTVQLIGDARGWADRGWTQASDGRWAAPWSRSDASPAASALVVDVATGHVLVGMRKKPPLRWSIPGGRGEAGEDAPTTAARELFEETGVRLETPTGRPRWTFYLGGQPGRPLWRLDVVVALTLGQTDVMETDEFAPVWLSIGAALRLDNLAPTVRHVLADVRAHRAAGGSWPALLTEP